MADKRTLTQRIALDGGKEIEAELKALGKAGEAAFRQLQRAAERTKLDTPLQKLRSEFLRLRKVGRDIGQAFQPLGKSVNALGVSVRGMATNFTVAAGAITAAAGAAALFAKSTAASAAEIKKQADLLGISVEAFQDLSAVAEENDISQSRLDQFLTRFNLALADVGEEAKKTAEELKKSGPPLNSIGAFAGAAGVKTLTLKKGLEDVREAVDGIKKPADDAAAAIAKIPGANPAEKLQNFAKQVAAIEDPLKRLKLVTDTFELGIREAGSAVTFFTALAANLEATGKAAGEAVRPLNELEVAIGGRLDDAFDRLSTNLERLKLGFAVPFQDALAPALEELNRLLVENQDRIRAFAQEIVNTVQPVIEDLFNAIAGNDEAVQNPAILKLRDDVVAFGRDLQVVYNEIVKPAFEGIQSAAQTVADAVNAIFGTDFSGRQILIAGAIGLVSGAFDVLAKSIVVVAGLINGLVTAVGILVFAFGGLPVAIGAFVIALGAALALLGPEGVAKLSLGIIKFLLDLPKKAAEAVAPLAQELISAIGEAIDGAIEFVGQKATEIGAAISESIGDGVAGLTDIISNLVNEAIEAFKRLPDALEDLFDDAVESIKKALGSVGKFIADLISDIRRALNLADRAESSSSGSGSGGQGFAGGGMVRGPGGPRGDKIRAWLSDKEFVEPAHVVEHYGVGFFEALRRGKIALSDVRALMSGFSGFSTGGFVSGFRDAFAIPRFADGGLVQGSMALAPAAVASGTPVHLTIEDRTFVLSAAPDVATDLHRAAMQRNLARIGRAPGWAGR